jgi:hypothetical protein
MHYFILPVGPVALGPLRACKETYRTITAFGFRNASSISRCSRWRHQVAAAGSKQACVTIRVPQARAPGIDRNSGTQQSGRAAQRRSLAYQLCRVTAICIATDRMNSSPLVQRPTLLILVNPPAAAHVPGWPAVGAVCLCPIP